MIILGDVDRALKESDIIVEETFKTSKPTATPLEPHASLASYDPFERKLTLWTSTQSVFMDRKMLAQSFGLPLNKVRVIAPEGIGGGFGNKLDFSPDRYIASALSMKTGKPVKVVLSREEETKAGITRHPITIESKMGISKDGRILAHKCRVVAAAGAYASDGPGVMAACGRYLHELYRIANARSDMLLVYTNRTVAGAFRGFGHSSSSVRLEQMVDIAAERLEMDP